MFRETSYLLSIREYYSFNNLHKIITNNNIALSY